MTDRTGRSLERSPVALVRDPAGEMSVVACCSAVYGSPIAELLVGESLHPGGLEGTRVLLRAAGLAPGSRLLDAGCGLGASARLAAAEAGLEVDAVDASAPVLARAAGRPGAESVRWARADVTELPFPDGTFDGVLAECVLSTLPREAGLVEVRRVLRPGGRLLMSDVVVGDGPIHALADHAILGAALCVTTAWREGEMEERLPAAGFAVERSWDRSATILTLVDRVEARVALAAAASRDLGFDLRSLLATDRLGGAPVETDDGIHLNGATVGRVADDVRRAVHDGSLRYLAVVARAV